MAVITNLRYADGVDALAEEELELEAQATKLSANDIQREIEVKGQSNKLQIPYRSCLT